MTASDSHQIMTKQPSRHRRPRLIGYARISRPEQRLASQIDALVKAGVRAEAPS